MSTPQPKCHEEEPPQPQCHEEEFEYAIDIKLNIPICLEPRIFTKGLSVHTSQKVKIRIQPNIQIVSDMSGTAPNCNFQVDHNQSQPEIILEGTLEQA